MCIELLWGHRKGLEVDGGDAHTTWSVNSVPRNSPWWVKIINFILFYYSMFLKPRN